MSTLQTPSIVFKFCIAEGGKDILQNRSLFITSPLDLNDPFEMRPAWTDAHAQWHHEKEQLKRKMMVGKAVIAGMEEGPHSLITIPYSEPPPCIPVDRQWGIADHHNDRVFRLLHDNYRILSFATGILDVEKGHGTSEESSTLMWSHYADSFQGVCLAFDATKFENGIMPGGYTMDYSHVRKGLPLSFYDDSLRCSPPETPNQKWQKDLITFLTQKSPAWIYEQEVRMIYDLPTIRASQHYADPDPKFPCEQCSSAKKTWEQCPNPTFRDAIRVPPEAFLAVIFGTDTSKADVEAILKALASPDFKNVRVYWSSLHSDKYVIQYNLDEKQEREPYSLFMQKLREKQITQAKGHVSYESGKPLYRSAKKTVNYLPKAEADKKP